VRLSPATTAALCSGTEEKQMPSLRNLLPEQRTIAFDFGDGHSVRIVYDPRELIYEPEEIEARRDDDDVRNITAEDLARAVIEWDVTGPLPLKPKGGYDVGGLVPEGQVIPLDARILAFMPWEVNNAILGAITMDGQIDPKRTQKRLQRLGSSRTSTSSNGRQEEPSHSLTT
jgi:hypothetical protein